MSELEPITREELLLNSIAGEGSSNLTPITRQEQYLSAIAGETELPSDMKPITREEIYYQKILDNGGAGGGGGDEPTGTIQITFNGTHNVADYAEAVVNVPNSYASSDEGKVVSNGALASQTSRSVTANGTYDTMLNSSVEVNVPASGITPSGTLSIQSDGNYDVTNYASVEVNTLMEKITVSGTAVTQTIDPNKFYVFGEVTSLAITLGTEVSGYVNEYHFRFTSGSTATVLTLPQSVTMPSDFSVEESKTYEISIVDGFGTVTEW